MQRFFPLVILLACLQLMPAMSADAGFFKSSNLVSIDGQGYSADDFKFWWKFWKEEGTPIDSGLDSYINWLLLSREADRMDLASSPSFQRQTRVFLLARSIMMLKYDAVDSRIKVTDDMVKARYREEYLPLWQLQELHFKDEEAALAAWQKLTDKTLSVEELLALGSDQGGFESTKVYWVRANGIDQGWADIFKEMQVGEVVDPEKAVRGKVLILLKDQKGETEKDYQKFYNDIKRTIWKEQEDVLSSALLEELRNKYQVKVDEERLEALDINAPLDSYSDADLITTSQQSFSEHDFMFVVKNLMRKRPQFGHAASNKDLARQVKLETVNNILSQYLTNWEALDRHYENKEPFKPEYDFNRKIRLIQALESQLFNSQVTVSDDEISEYYNQNLGNFSNPGISSLYILDETQVPIDKIWAEVSAGGDFQKVFKTYSDAAMKMHKVPTNHLDPEVKAVVEKLTDGETSHIFTSQGIRVLVHLFKKTLDTPIPLENVKGKIRNMLTNKKVMQLRSAYLEKLKSASQIDIDERQWQAIQKELGGA